MGNLPSPSGRGLGEGLNICRDLCTRTLRKLIISSTVEQAAGFRFVYAAPLFKEECDALALATIAYLPDPPLFHWPCSSSAFASGDHPIDAGQIERAKIFK